MSEPNALPTFVGNLLRCPGCGSTELRMDGALAHVLPSGEESIRERLEVSAQIRQGAHVVRCVEERFIGRELDASVDFCCLSCNQIYRLSFVKQENEIAVQTKAIGYRAPLIE